MLTSWAMSLIRPHGADKAEKLVHWSYLVDGWKMRFFHPKEFACKCCSRVMISPGAAASWERLDAVRREMGCPLHLTSATRCGEHNEKVGGVPDSMHLRGRAYDITAPYAQFKVRLVYSAGRVGMNGVGVYRDFVHMDDRNVARPVFWLPD